MIVVLHGVLVAIDGNERQPRRTGPTSERAGRDRLRFGKVERQAANASATDRYGLRDGRVIVLLVAPGEDHLGDPSAA